MLPRPKARPAFALVRIAVTTLFAVHVFLSAWLVATAEGTYTEGKPAPTSASSLIAIDKDQTAIDVRIERATSFFFYTLERDGGASVPVEQPPEQANQTTGEKEEQSESNNGDSASASQEERDWLELGRQTVTASLVMLVLSELLMLVPFRWRHHLRSLAFVFTLVSFSVLFPACYMLELSGGEGDDEGDNTATNTPGANIETVSFVHTKSSSDFRLIWLGVELKADFSGYDLGLVESENRTQVWQEVPEEGSKDAKSFIAFESTFDIQLGKNLDSLLVLPFMWFLLPAASVQKSKGIAKTEEEE